MFKKNYSIRLTQIYILPFHLLITEYDFEEKSVFLTTKVIKIGAISNRNRKTIKKLCSTILKAVILWWSN